MRMTHSLPLLLSQVLVHSSDVVLSCTLVHSDGLALAVHLVHSLPPYSSSGSSGLTLLTLNVVVSFTFSISVSA